MHCFHVLEPELIYNVICRFVTTDDLYEPVEDGTKDQVCFATLYRTMFRDDNSEIS